MDIVVIAAQVVLLMLALPLLATSLRTSRGHRSRHAGFMAVALLLALLACVLALASVGLASEQPAFDAALSFVPPLCTLMLCGWVVLRAGGPGRRRVPPPAR